MGNAANVMKTHYAPTRATWRAWLARNHRSAPEIWLVFYKKHTGKPSVTLGEAIDEGLCFGWIDTRVRSLDDARYAQRFTPRAPSSRWSASNIARVRKLIAQRKMTAAGLSAFKGHELRKAPALPTKLPPELNVLFRRSGKAWRNFERCPPGYKRYAIGWVASAKRDETRRKRLARLVATSARAERLPFI